MGVSKNSELAAANGHVSQRCQGRTHSWLEVGHIHSATAIDRCADCGVYAARTVNPSNRETVRYVP